MAVTYGFYNSINHDRMYDATQFSEMFDGIIHDGVYELLVNDDGTPTKKFMVETTGTGFQVTVDNGRAWFHHTWTKNDAKILINLPAPPTLVNRYRYDAIVIDINANTDVRENKITYVQGTEGASSDPAKPSLENSGLHYQVPLAYILRVGRETSISQSNINITVGTPECPYVAGAIEFIDISNHIKQFQATWYEWFDGFKSTNVGSFEAWKEECEAWFRELQTWTDGKESIFDGWMNTQQASFEAWFENLRYVLDGDVAGHLQNEIDALGDRIVPVKKGGTGNSHGHIQSGHHESSYISGSIGEYATAEGMNTFASGKSSHAEGGGSYTSESVVAHLEDNGRKIATDNTNPYYDYGYHTYASISKTVTGSATEDVTWYDKYPEENQDLGYNYIISSDDKYKWGENESDPYLHGRIVSAYVYVELKDETEGKILKNVVLTDGDNVKYSKAYNNGNRVISAYDTLVVDNGVYEEIDENTIVGRDDDGNPIYKRFNYWYMDGTTPQNSTVIFSLVPCLRKFDYQARIGYMGGINSQKASIINQDSENHGLLIKAGNTHTYSIKMYCSYTLESECIDKEYYRKDVSNAVYSFNVQSGTQRGVNQSINLDTIKSISVEWVDYNGICISRNVEIPVQGSSSTGTVGPFICCKSDNSEVISVGLTYNFTTQKWTGITISPNEHASTSYGGTFQNSYVVKVSDKPLAGYTMSKTVGGEDTGFEYYLDWIDAHEDLSMDSLPTRALGDYSHAEGYKTKAKGKYSHSEGYAELHYISQDRDSLPGAYGMASHVEGWDTIANGTASHAEGFKTTAGIYAHAEGEETISSGYGCHSEGYKTEASGQYSHAEGYNAEAIGNYSHVEGENSKAYANNSHAGAGGVATIVGQFVHGVVGFGGIEEVLEPTANGDWTASNYGTSILLKNGENVFAGGAFKYSADSIASTTYFDVKLVGTSSSEWDEQCENRLWLCAISVTCGTTRYVRLYTIQSYRKTSNTQIGFEITLIGQDTSESSPFSLTTQSAKVANGVVSIKGTATSNAVHMRAQIIRIM